MREPRPGLPWSRGRLRRRGRYASYMGSLDWQARREAWHAEWLDRYGIEPMCVVCDERWTERHGDLHHRSYDRLGRERFDDLVPLCRAHHRALHDLWDGSSAWRSLGRASATIGIIATLRRRENLAPEGECGARAC